MSDIIKPDGTIDMTELSRQNGKTPFENFKAILELLSTKAEVTGKPETLRLLVTKEASRQWPAQTLTH